MFSCEINRHVYICLYRNRVFLRDSGFFPVSRFEIRLDYFKFSSANMILIYFEGQLFTTKYVEHVHYHVFIIRIFSQRKRQLKRIAALQIQRLSRILNPEIFSLISFYTCMT